MESLKVGEASSTTLRAPAHSRRRGLATTEAENEMEVESNSQKSTGVAGVSEISVVGTASVALWCPARVPETLELLESCKDSEVSESSGVLESRYVSDGSEVLESC